MSAALPPPTVALFPWGEVIEEFLDPIGLSVQDFAGQMSGGWLFGARTCCCRPGRKRMATNW